MILRVVTLLALLFASVLCDTPPVAAPEQPDRFLSIAAKRPPPPAKPATQAGGKVRPKVAPAAGKRAPAKPAAARKSPTAGKVAAGKKNQSAPATPAKPKSVPAAPAPVGKKPEASSEPAARIRPQDALRLKIVAAEQAVKNAKAAEVAAVQRAKAAQDDAAKVSASANEFTSRAKAAAAAAKAAEELVSATRGASARTAGELMGRVKHAEDTSKNATEQLKDLELKLKLMERNTTRLQAAADDAAAKAKAAHENAGWFEAALDEALANHETELTDLKATAKAHKIAAEQAQKLSSETQAALDMAKSVQGATDDALAAAKDEKTHLANEYEKLKKAHDELMTAKAAEGEVAEQKLAEAAAQEKQAEAEAKSAKAHEDCAKAEAAKKMEAAAMAASEAEVEGEKAKADAAAVVSGFEGEIINLEKEVVELKTLQEATQFQVQEAEAEVSRLKAAGGDALAESDAAAGKAAEAAATLEGIGTEARVAQSHVAALKTRLHGMLGAKTEAGPRLQTAIQDFVNAQHDRMAKLTGELEAAVMS